MAEYDPEVVKDSKCYDLYTISKEERTYDEPFAGDPQANSGRRSWLCCPGTQQQQQQRLEVEQPPLVDVRMVAPMDISSPITQPPHIFCNATCERLQQQLDEQAQRYEEQLTELHSVIAELTRKLHQQRTMAIAEEDETSEACTSAHDDSMTCPLEVSELEPAENDLSDLENKLPLSESPLELPEPKLTSSHHETNAEISPYSEIVDPLRAEIVSLKAQLMESEAKLARATLQNGCSDSDNKCLDSPESHIETDYEPKLIDTKADIKYSNIVPIHKANIRNGYQASNNMPVSKMAERIKLKRATDQREVNPNDLINGDLSTVVAEHIVGDILRQCDAQSEKQAVDIEFKRISSKLEHARSQNSVLALTLTETKAHCDRLALLCGKYESNAIALRLALGVTDRAIEAYDVLLALLETEVAMTDPTPESVENRAAAESIAKQLLIHLDTYQSTDVLLSPWQNHVYNSPTSECGELWNTDHENRLREHVSRLKEERSNIQGTYVMLESTQVENPPIRAASNQEARKIDLEMAVLMQELMGLREDKTDLLSKLFVLEKEKSALEVKLKYVDGQQRAQGAALKNLQGQLKDTEALLALATQNKDKGYTDADHAQGIELELMQALAREARLKVRLQELIATLEQVTKNAEARLLEGREIVHDLNHTNSVLAETVDRNNKKYQARFKKMEQQMMVMVERHTAQVQNLQQRITTLESPTPNTSSEISNSSSVAV
ncbi:PREDICTED: colorectal mutant cancer protein isoform X2 [Nicrophorus vespilloides]|uniref:Colorectal mutant cancer protein isoform X2 n=1 Tax=Nicrophorus vespilloides TaxID=110193 RepID=A0ABM1MKL9_NICVS|nr:PREDICTED: colorectal mutant cancer protein isoform X2 [Nicrophorus vespilloides]XP_017775120.1 PREDICTED: colorectal mutant cancer protein isoform X2 [Nicrophorus vespilloides]XP_017775121.1 PREDICTED: colorectal mutant cancer protein isoform X2 [Nicrophorus vespilloides]